MNGHKPEHSARIFFALLPDAQTVAAIESHAAQYSPLTGKKVRPENYHITLLFLGNVEQRRIDALCLDCRDIHSPAFTLTISESGWWQKAGILWLGPASTPEPLAGLVDKLNALAGQRRLVRDRRPYSPHITLMRKVTHAPLQPLVQPFTWHADSFSLMESITLPEGVQYRELASWPLQG